MRFGIDAHHVNGKPQGSRTYLVQLVRALAPLVEDDDELHLFSFDPEATSALIGINGGRHHRLFPRSAKLRPRHVPGLDRVVLGGEVEVGRAGDEDRAGLDRTERELEVTAVDGIGADVALLPRPELREQIVRVPVELVLLPREEVILERPPRSAHRCSAM